MSTNIFSLGRSETDWIGADYKQDFQADYTDI